MNKKTATLDSKHNEKMCEFDKIENKLIPAWKEERKKLILAKDKAENIVDRLKMADGIQELTKKIRKNRKLRKCYLLENSQYIFDYFEKKKEVSAGNSKKKILHAFFDKNEKKSVVKKQYCNDIQKYFEAVDEKTINIENYTLYHDICKCGGELVPIDYEGILVCKRCYNQTPYLIEHEKPSYKEPPKEVCFYAYKRINHFREILAQFQAKETTQIPEEVLKISKRKLKKKEFNYHKLPIVKQKIF